MQLAQFVEKAAEGSLLRQVQLRWRFRFINGQSVAAMLTRARH